MTRSSPGKGLQRAVADAQAKAEKRRQALASRQGGASPGDLYRSPADTPGVLWGVVQFDPDDIRHVFAVPADDHPLAGAADVVLPRKAASGPLVLRCGQGLWIPTVHLIDGARDGVLEEPYVLAARKKLAALVRGTLVTNAREREAEADPEYEHWMDEVASARQRLSDWLDEAGLVVRLADFQERAPWPSAKTAFEAAAGGITAAPPLPALAAAPSGLLADIARILVDQPTIAAYFALDSKCPGTLCLRASAAGVGALWRGTSRQRPPRLQGKRPSGGWQATRWRRTADGTIFETSTVFSWIGGRVLLRVGSGTGQRVTVVP